jgi:hypothetical protein
MPHLGALYEELRAAFPAYEMAYLEVLARELRSSIEMFESADMPEGVDLVNTIFDRGFLGYRLVKVGQANG